jgi:peptide/nickel transport system substrate-binding protein
MDDDKPTRWQRLQKLSFNRKSLSRRMQRAEGVTLRHARKFIVRRIGNAREVQRHIIIWIIAIGILIGATGLQVVWYQQNYFTHAAALDGTYAEAVLGPVNTLDPLFASSSAEVSASRLLFSSLLSYDTSGHLSNDLATNISVDPTSKIYTVTLRSDAKWSDGIKLTAEDVAFTVGLIKNPTVRSTITGWNDIKVSVSDEKTVVFTLPAVYASFPHALTGLPIVPKHILSSLEPNTIRQADFSTSPVGSGPFQFRFVQDIDPKVGRKIIHLARNDSYYNGISKLARFQLHVYGTQDQILQALISGEVNASSDLSATSAKQVSTDHYSISDSPIDSGVYALFNTARAPLNDKLVRQALQRGTDTKAIRASLPLISPALDLPFIDGQITGDVPKVAEYDKAAAASLLDKAGWKLDGAVRKKDGEALTITVVTTKNSDYERVLETLVGEWRKLGITIKTSVVDPSDISQQVTQTILQPRDFDVLLYQLTIGADPDVYAYWHSSQAYPNSGGFNFSNYTNAISDDALSSARTRLEPSLRNAKYVSFAKQWISDVPAIGLYQSTAPYVSSKNIQSYTTSNTLISPTDRYADVLYWADGTRQVYKTP